MAISGRGGYLFLKGDPNWMDKLTFGLDFSRKTFGLNYVYLPQEDLGGTQRLGITFTFGGPLTRKIYLFDRSRAQGPHFFVQDPLDGSPVPTGESRLKSEMCRNELFDQAETLYNESRMLRAVGEEIRLCREELYAAAMVAERKGEWSSAMNGYRSSQSGLKSFIVDSADPVVALSSREAVQEASSVQRGKEETHQLYEKGMVAYSAKEFDKARRLFESAVKANPRDKKEVKALERLKEEMGGLRP